MSAPIIYSGPAKVVMFNGGASPGQIAMLQADGENGQVKVQFDEKRTKRATGMTGYLRSTLDDQTVKVSLTPFDSWSLLPYMFPAYLGIVTGATFQSSGAALPSSVAGALAIGTRPHAVNGQAGSSPTGNAPTKIWTPDGRLITIARTAVTKHPSLKLGVGMPLFTGIELTGLVPPANSIGASSGLISIAGDTQNSQSASADPDTIGAVFDAFINGHWTGIFTGSVSGGLTTGVMDAEDGWDIAVEAKYSPLHVQKRTYDYKLDSVEVMVKARITNQTAAALLAEILAHTLGGTLEESASASGGTLILSGPSSKFIGLPNCVPYLEGSGFEFGGTKLNQGEVAFVSKIDVVAGSSSPATLNSPLIFSA